MKQRQREGTESNKRTVRERKSESSRLPKNELLTGNTQNPKHKETLTNVEAILFTCAMSNLLRGVQVAIGISRADFVDDTFGHVLDVC